MFLLLFLYFLLIWRLAVRLFFNNPRVVLSATFIFALVVVSVGFCCGFKFAVITHVYYILYFLPGGL